ncbi:RNA-directed DNA polymerase, eukaryota, reverse transcriptase zinc-binding domain protein [Tanacetum coccineum]
MCTGRVCISTKSHQPVSEKVNVEIHGETFETQVHEIGTWSINIVEESDISSTGDENEIEKDADSSDANSVDGLEDVIKNLNNSKEDEESNGGSPKVIVEDSQIAKEANTSDLSCPPGFEHLKRESTRRCSTSFAKRQNKDIKGISFIHELSRLIEVGGSLGLVVRGCRKSLKNMINGIGLTSLARGRSGGLISMWYLNNFMKEDIWCDDAFIIVKGGWKNTIIMVNIYGPHDPLAKSVLWNRIRDFMHSNRGKYILLCDMNEVRNAQERYGSIFSRSEAEVFNTFINSTNLIDLPMGGHSFTWMNKQGTKLSKLDRFLISEEVLNFLPDICI